MLNLSAILKKYREDRKRRDSEPEAEDAAPQKINGDAAVEQVSRADQIKISSALDRESDNNNYAIAKPLYEEAFSLALQIYRPDLSQQQNLAEGAHALAEKLLDALASGNKELLKLCLSDYADARQYLYYHAVNVCVICIEIGLGLGYERQRLVELGIAAFLHDIGIVEYLALINQPKILSNEEYAKIKDHPDKGTALLNRIGKGLSNSVLEAVQQEHERKDGSGYPRGLKNKGICDFAEILGLADTYEAMIHQRPHRGKFSPLEAVKTIISHKESFSGKIAKILIERVGIFPLGIPVRLNTKEIGLVVKENQRLPFRPVVNIIMDASGKEIREQKLVDLSKNPMLYIEECIESIKK